MSGKAAVKTFHNQAKKKSRKKNKPLCDSYAVFQSDVILSMTTKPLKQWTAVNKFILPEEMEIVSFGTDSS